MEPKSTSGNEVDAAANGALLERVASEVQAIGAHLKSLDDGVGRELRGIDARLLQIEGKAGKPDAPKPLYRRIAWEKVLSAVQILAMPIVIAYVGWQLSGKLDLAIKQQQADLAGVKEMQDSLKILYAEDSAADDFYRAALFVGAFGGVAAGPLVQAYDLGGDSRELAAERGLVAAGVRDKIRVCEVLKVVAASKGDTYRAETRTVAAKISGGLDCGSNG